MNAPPPDAPRAEWLVFSDSLQHQGDPRGELIALVNSGDATKRDAFVAAHADSLLGPAPAAHLGKGLKVGWRQGYISSAEVRGVTVDALSVVVDALLAAPLAQHMSVLKLVGVPADERLELAGVVARLSRARLTSLSLVDARAAASTRLTSRDIEPAPNLVDFGPLAAVWAMPSLRSLEVVVADVRQLDPGAIVSPTLESLGVLGLRVAETDYDGTSEACEFAVALAEATLPRLNQFEMRLCEEWTANSLDDDGAYVPQGFHEEPVEEENRGANWNAEFGDALSMLAKAPLTRLALPSFHSSESLLGTLAARGLSPTLEELDLSDSSLGDGAIAWFKENAALFSTLKRLVVRNSALSVEGARSLAQLGPKVEYSQKRLVPTWRYVVGME